MPTHFTIISVSEFYIKRGVFSTNHPFQKLKGENRHDIRYKNIMDKLQCS